ncbi:CYTH and CHAD domain-containing protein [Trujillonella endophytica]|uniref:CHAD domain-containing protein n=1 Tax=Trujillonella endophytica TaxID=673521 RepID=A0A1H8VD01_9ACTN|nr:CYTH and CHAD domain-containing protein [Trujillella endophytica]SEP13104.1 CHAD domain-containing protein [Trujillella endophytica]
MVGHVEIERKVEPGPGFVLPDLSTVEGVSAVGEPVEHHLAATYFDTADLRLARARITLRRRTGGTDAGWHLKLPAEGFARQERHHPLGPRRALPPKAVLEPVLGIVRSVPVGAVATLDTTRVVTTVLGEDGRVLAEVADDTVVGTALPADPEGAATVTSWREVEVELVDGDEALLDALVAAVVDAGAEPSDSPSKLARVLADRLPALSPSATAKESGKRAKKGGKKKAKAAASASAASTAADVVLTALRAQVEALQAADLLVRTGHPDGVHDLRVACRRIRSILAAFRPVLEREATDPLREELRWVGAALSAARDGEVALAHLRALVDAQPLEQVRGPVVARLQTAAVQDAEAGRRKALRTLADRRYLAVLDALDALLAEPPLAAAAGEPAGPVLARAIRGSGKRLAERIAAARADEEEIPHEDSALHEVRKAAKRVRYTAEVAVPVLGDPARALMTAMEGVQEVLGAAQDTVATRDRCLRLGRAAGAAGESTWTWGRIHALEEGRAAACAAAFWRLEPGLRPVLRAAATT